MALKIGIVGLRGIGNQHADCHIADPLADLVAVCDVVKERADETAAKHGVRAYYKLSDMLANEELDIVDVTTGGFENGSWHYEPAMEAIEAGKHVHVEKPLSNNILEAREMVAAAAKKRVYLGCNLNHYFTPPAEKADEAIAAGLVGEQIYCLHKMGFQGGEPAGYQCPRDPRSYQLPYFHLKAFLTHPFSVMRHFCGDITHVQAFVDRPGFRRRVGEFMLTNCSINVRFASGAVGCLLSQRGDAAFGLGGWWSFELAGTQGTFCIENCIEKFTYWKAPAGTADPAALQTGGTGDMVEFNSGITDFGQTFPRRLHAFLEDISNGVHLENVRASGRDALAALEYTWAVMESYEQGGEMVRPHPLPNLHGDPTTIA